MANYDFKNALIGQNATLDPSWPCLNATNKLAKKTTKKANECKLAQPVDTIGGSSIALTPETCQSAKHENKSEEVNFANTEFPELSSICVRQKRLFSVNENSVKDHCSNYNDTKTSLKCYKHTKLKNDIINVPLISFIKEYREKRTMPKKRASHLKQMSHLFCGNKLDSDKPVRRKGKVRMFKIKRESRLRKEILLSRRMKTKYAYNQSMLKIKRFIPGIINCNNDINIDKLGLLLDSIKLDQNRVEETESENLLAYKVAPHGVAKRILHSNVFRTYCTNMVTSALVKNAESLVIKLRSFQDRQHAKDASKAFAKRRYLCGFKETKKFLVADKIKLLIVATNLQLETGLPSGRVLEEISTLSKEKNIPLVFVGRGNQIGYWTLKRRRISIVSVLNYEGAEDAFRNLIETWMDCKKMYQTALKEIENRLTSDNKIQILDKHIEEEIKDTILAKLSIENLKI